MKSFIWRIKTSTQNYACSQRHDGQTQWGPGSWSLVKERALTTASVETRLISKCYLCFLALGVSRPPILETTSSEVKLTPYTRNDNMGNLPHPLHKERHYGEPTPPPTHGTTLWGTNPTPYTRYDTMGNQPHPLHKVRHHGEPTPPPTQGTTPWGSKVINTL